VVVKQLQSENRGLQVRASKALAEAPAEIRPAVAGPKAVEALPQVESLTKYVYPYGDSALTPSLRKEAVKTAGMLKAIQGKAPQRLARQPVASGHRGRKSCARRIKD
jgi:hypothetical protein